MFVTLLASDLHHRTCADGLLPEASSNARVSRPHRTWFAGSNRDFAGDDVIKSGKDNDRPELRKAIAYCKLTRSTLLIAKLDRPAL